jgi:hypothetical protein
LQAGRDEFNSVSRRVLIWAASVDEYGTIPAQNRTSHEADVSRTPIFTLEVRGAVTSSDGRRAGVPQPALAGDGTGEGVRMIGALVRA